MLSPDNLIIVGVLASVLTQGLRLIAEYFGYVPSKIVINVVLFALSIGLGIAFFGVPVVGPDVVAGLVSAGVQIAGSALLIYNVLLDKVLMPPASKLATVLKFK